MLTIVYCFLAFGIIRADVSPLCNIWNTIEENLKRDEFQFTCLKKDDCFGMNCSGTAHGYDVKSMIQLHVCGNNPNLEFQVSIPKLNINNIKKIIYHNDSIELSRSIKLEFEIEKRSKKLLLSLCIIYLHNSSFPLLRAPLKFPVINNVEFSVSCSSVEASTSSIEKITSPSPKLFLPVSGELNDRYSNCSIKNSSCNDNEMCRQLDKSKADGICTCIPSYKRNEDGKCIYDPTLDITTTEPPGEDNRHKSSNVSLLLTAILVPIFVIFTLIGLVYASIRFRICQHLRRRLRVQVYEHVRLGEDEDDDTNPIA